MSKDSMMSNKSMHEAPEYRTGVLPAVLTMLEVVYEGGQLKDLLGGNSDKFASLKNNVESKEIGPYNKKVVSNIRSKYPDQYKKIESVSWMNMASALPEIIADAPASIRAAMSRDIGNYMDWKAFYVGKWIPVLNESVSFVTDGDVEKVAKLREEFTGLTGELKLSGFFSPLTQPVVMTTSERDVGQYSFEPSSPEKSLRVAPTSKPTGGGMTSSPDVEFAQKVLTSLGFDTKGVDGKLGNNTRTAILAFQKKNGLPATGNLDPATMAKLKSMAPSSLAASLGGKSEGMSTGMKIGLAVAGVAAVGGLAYYFLSDDEDEVEG